MKEVALRANVSATTASLFFNGRDDVCSEATAARLLQAAAELNYKVDRSQRIAVGTRGASRNPERRSASQANSLAAPRVADPLAANADGLEAISATYVLGVCMPHDTLENGASALKPRRVYPNTFLEQVWRGISHIGDVEHCRILQYPRQVREGLAIEPFLRDSRVNGLIMLARPDDPRPQQLAAAGLPVMLIGRSGTIPDGCGAVYALENNTVDLALGHLWQFGHRRIAHFGGLMTREPGAGAQIDERRLDRYVSWLQQRKAFDPELVIRFDDRQNLAVQVVAALASALSQPEPPTAFFCSSDEVAVEVCRAAAARGLQIPGDISVLGIDNSVYGAENVPSLSSIEIPYEQVGIEAVVQLTRMLQGATAAASRMAIAVTNLVARESTGPVRVA